MKKSTPVIMGVLLIVGIVALGYFADLENTANNTTSNNTTKYSLFKINNLTDQTQAAPQDQVQQTPDTTSSSNSNVNNQNTTNNATSQQNITASSPG